MYNPMSVILPIIYEEKEIEYILNNKANITTPINYAGHETSTLRNNKVDACENQLQYQQQNSDKLRFDLCGMINVKQHDINETNNKGKSRQNNDNKLSFKSIHTLAVFFALFANSFGISNSDNGIIFEDGNSTFINVND